jgi:tryptophan synthase alpha chain
MTYYNPVLQYGLERFAINAVQSGVDGLIVPDLPYEESEPLRLHADQCGLDLIPLVAPTSTPTRLSAICSAARGFVYCVAVTGVTGARDQIETDLDALTREVRKHTALPVALGFGVSGPESAAHISTFCDAVVVGSSLVSLIGEKNYDCVEELTARLKTAI